MHHDDMPRLQVLENGEKSWSPFSEGELQGRQDRLRRRMEELKLDACVFTSYHNICYFSGFLYCSFGRRYGFVVDEHRATVIAAGIDGGQPWRRVLGDALTYTDWNKDNYFHALQAALFSSGRKPARIGIEFDHVSLDLMAKLQAALPGVELVDVSDAVMRMRTIKSLEEQALIREGTRICDIGGAAVAGAVRAGVPEHEVALAGTQAMVRAIAASFPFVELMDTWVWFQSGINTDGAHNPVTNRVVQAGDILSLNCFPMIFGYYTALERTLFCNHVSDAHLRLWEINCEVHRAGLELIRPGARCCDIAATLNDIYRRYDLLQYRSFGYGHSFGVLSHYYGREAAVELREDVETVLEPGMVVSMEPMIMIPEGLSGAGGYREHDILILTETGAENITGFPFGPEHNIVG
ncbi:M24 family metallopeptidase [Pannonibacter sp. SL95]|uniref:M24 family metallopeptidase n=1 Tax=Pannonibacter sp. SL95 TaxID=2995153 RepID=UPI002272DCCD|nr:M24 family metallopeptidase [Pannonibacter sp. SL95]MCY1705993.1 M24 family metallopeptidase [Pannonibacter sp. SL95]